ncbi:TfuA-like protein [Streptomyces sp. NPDC001414]|uniref:TfuA-like protein n=1 Tax=Streptomyces sp. NPDC048663 TaxID=3155638 RepID=UPI0034120E07
MRTTIFTGPSLPPGEARALLPQADVLPPARRGDVYRARESGSSRILIIDGSFSQVLPVSPREVVEVARDGAQVVGASSMGAVRAAECWPVGVHGVGAVYRMYRAGLFDSDDPVVVATDPDDDHAAVSVALVNIRAAVRRLYGLRLITRSQGAELRRVAEESYYPDRVWRLLFKKAGIDDPGGVIAEAAARVDIKRTDALRAVRFLSALPVGAPADGDGRRFGQGPRYASHDPLLGHSRTELDLSLPPFVFGTGRYQKYIRFLLAGQVDFAGLTAEGGSKLSRNPSVEPALARLFLDRPSLSANLMDKIRHFRQFETEVMLWHAVRRLKDHKTSRTEVTPPQEAKARDSVARAHGYDDWDTLTADVRGDALPSGVPLAWIEEACRDLALARS